MFSVSFLKKLMFSGIYAYLIEFYVPVVELGQEFCSEKWASIHLCVCLVLVVDGEVFE